MRTITAVPNIANLYIIKIAKWFNLVMPVVVLFYQSNGMGMQEIFWLKSIYSVGIVMMEIPSGYLADVWGRKKSLLTGAVLGTVGFGLYSISHGFWAFALAELVLGIGYSFVSGSDSAMLYDSLKEAQQEKKYIKQEGWITSTGNFAEAIAGVCGGLLATVTLRTPFYFQFAIASMAIPAALLLKEPKLHGRELSRTFRGILRAVKETFSHVELRSALLVSSFTGTASLTFAWFVQPYFQQAGLPVSLFGVMWTVLNLTVGVSALFSYKVEHLLGQRRSLLLIIGGLSVGFFLSAIEISLAGIAFLLFFYLLRGVAHPILKDYIHEYTGSDVRATVLSLRDFVIRINFAVIGPVLGFLTDRFSLGVALAVAGGSYLLMSVAAVLPLLRKKE